MGRIVGLMWAAITGKSHMWLCHADRMRAASDLTDADLVKWSRWALANAAQFYENDAKSRARDLMEVTTMHAVVALALMTLKADATSATFSVDGVTFRGESKGDWRVTIEQLEEPTP